MPGESLSFSITADDRASSKFRDVGRAAADSSVKIDLAAASLKLWDDTATKQGKAANTSLNAMKAHAKATSLLADAENVLAGRATTTTRLLADQGRKLETAGKTAENAAGGFSVLAGSGGIPGGGMGALIAAGGVLSPILVTLGAGVTGFGLAAAGVAKPIENAAQKTGGLQANLAKLNPEQQAVAKSLLGLGQQYGVFERQLQPEVFGVFNKGLSLAGHLLHDLQPVTVATGKGLAGVLAQVDKEFASGTWQQFFGFMAKTAGPDLQQLGALFTGLLGDLPPLIEGLQPLASGLIGVATDATKVIGVLSQLHLSLPVLGATIGAFAGGPIGALIGGLTGVSLDLAKVHTAVDATIPSWTKSADATAGAIASLGAYGPQVAKYIEWLHQSDQAGNNTIAVQKQFAQANSAATIALQNAGVQALIAGRGLLAGAAGMHEMNTQAYLAISPTDHLGKVASAAGDSGWYLSKAVSASSTGVLHLGNVTENTVTSTGHFAKVAKPLTVTLYDWSTNASQAAIQTANMATAVANLNSAQSKALGNLVTYSNDILTTSNDAVGLRKALQASGNEIGTHTAKQRASFQAANTFITDLSNQAQAAITSGKGINAASRAISTNLPLLDSAKTKSRLYWQEVQTLTNWLHKLKDLKNIREVVVVTGTGTWTMHNPANQSLPGGFPGAAGAAAGMFVTGGTPGRDSVLIKAMPGEVVVPARMVSAGAVDHLRGSIPGFASGGVVQSYSGNVPGLQPWITGNTNAQIKVFGQDVASALLAAMKAAQQEAAFLGGGTPGPGGGAPAANAALARHMMPRWGGGAEWAAWNYVAMRESGWNQFARNPSSGAYGIPQALPPSKMGPAANPPQSNPAAQISWMIGYIGSQYGDPIGAAAHERAFNWYDKGGLLQPGWTLAYNGTGRPEMVLPNRPPTAAAPVTRHSQGGPLVSVAQMVVQDATDAHLVAQRLSFSITAAGLGS